MTEVKIFTEETPNPNAMKFITTKLLLNGSVDYANAEAAQNIPFVRDLFKFSFVTGVFAAGNFITINKTDGSNWADNVPMLKEYIKAGLEQGQTVVAPTSDSTGDVNFEGTDTEKRIQEILREYVQPAVEQDGGAIAYKSFDNGVVTVELRGSCSGCPSSTITLKSGIEGLLKRMVPEVTEVVSEAL